MEKPNSLSADVGEALAKIEARLRAATPWPWEPCEDGSEQPNLYGPGSFSEAGSRVALAMFYWPSHPIEKTKEAEDLTYANIRLCAHAPADLTYLIGLVRSLAAENAELLMEQESYAKIAGRSDDYKARASALEKENAELKSLINSDKYDGSALAQMYLAICESVTNAPNYKTLAMKLESAEARASALDKENAELKQKLQIAEQTIEVKQPGFDMYYHGLFREQMALRKAAEARAAQAELEREEYERRWKAVAKEIEDMESALREKDALIERAREAYNQGWYSCADVPPHDHADCGKCLECQFSSPAPKAACAKCDEKDALIGRAREAIRMCESDGGCRAYGVLESPAPKAATKPETKKEGA